MVRAVEFKSCPIRVSLGVLGKKLMLLILRGIAFLKIDRFNQIRRSVLGLTFRVLIMRLGELEESGLIEPILMQDKPKLIRLSLILMQAVLFCFVFYRIREVFALLYA
jgi:DNA-binding HxlR family transcriptional regulator